VGVGEQLEAKGIHMCSYSSLKNGFKRRVLLTLRRAAQAAPTIDTQQIRSAYSRTLRLQLQQTIQRPRPSISPCFRQYKAD